MKIKNKLTRPERAELLRGLTQNQGEHIAFMLARSHCCYHDLNALTYSLFKQYGIEYNGKDFEISKETEHAVYEALKKIENDKNKTYPIKSISYDCLRLAIYFLHLADVVKMVEDASV